MYTILALLGLTAVAALLTPPTAAHGELTIDPAMSKGPVGARVTILEFSDYQ